jgi:hypothetical protein
MTLKALGREHMDRKVTEGMRWRLEVEACEFILRDTNLVNGLIYATFKRICKEGDKQCGFPAFCEGTKRAVFGERIAKS